MEHTIFLKVAPVIVVLEKGNILPLMTTRKVAKEPPSLSTDSTRLEVDWYKASSR
jgi:hypothetical protein